GRGGEDPDDARPARGSGRARGRRGRRGDRAPADRPLARHDRRGLRRASGRQTSGFLDVPGDEGALRRQLGGDRAPVEQVHDLADEACRCLALDGDGDDLGCEAPEVLLQRSAGDLWKLRTHERGVEAARPDLANGCCRRIRLRDGTALGLETLRQLGPEGGGFVHDEYVRHESLPVSGHTYMIVIAAPLVGCKTHHPVLLIPCLARYYPRPWLGGRARRASRPRRRSPSRRGSGSSATAVASRSTTRISAITFVSARSATTTSACRRPSGSRRSWTRALSSRTIFTSRAGIPWDSAWMERNIAIA